MSWINSGRETALTAKKITRLDEVACSEPNRGFEGCSYISTEEDCTHNEDILLTCARGTRQTRAQLQ